LKKNQSQLSSEKDPEKIKILQDNISEIIKKYFKFDWEIDAYVSSEAQMIAEDILKKSRTKRDALEYIKNFVPDIPVLKFYKTQPTIWKRFIMHLTKIVERDYK
jgi:septum formation topological specificity factor MinE